MDAPELVRVIARGEDSRNQFKSDFSHAASLAAEMVAFSNTLGGQILVGVRDTGQISGLNSANIARLNQIVSNAGSQLVRPAINPLTQNIETDQGVVMVISIAQGLSKPYMDNAGVIWVKSGADKRKVTGREEIQRLFQSSSLIHGDQVPVFGLTIADLDTHTFRNYMKEQYGEEMLKEDPSEQLLTNMNLMQDGTFNLAGALLFTPYPQHRLPVFVIKCVSYPGEDIHAKEYRDSEDIGGNLSQMFKDTLGFVTRNLPKLQRGRGVNSVGELEIPRVALEELITNSLVHRDYFVLAPIRLFIFDNRIELISPGHLPNNLTVANIKNGNSNIRNPMLASFAAKMLPYRGLGTGIRRAIKEYPHIEFVDDRDGNAFIVTIEREPR